MGDILALLFNTAVFGAALRMATPLIFAAFGRNLLRTKRGCEYRP